MRRINHSHATSTDGPSPDPGAGGVRSSEVVGSVHDLPLVRKAADRGSLPAEPTGMRWLSAIALCAGSRGVRKGGWRPGADNCGGLMDQLVIVEGLYHE